jgi:hypothetical protein
MMGILGIQWESQKSNSNPKNPGSTKFTVFPLVQYIPYCFPLSSYMEKEAHVLSIFHSLKFNLRPFSTFVFLFEIVSLYSQLGLET